MVSGGLAVPNYQQLYKFYKNFGFFKFLLNLDVNCFILECYYYLPFYQKLWAILVGGGSSKGRKNSEHPHVLCP